MAELDGYHDIYVCNTRMERDPKGKFCCGTKNPLRHFGRELLPEYDEDINTITSLIAKLPADQLMRYADNLQEVVGTRCVGVVSDYHSNLISLAKLTNATAEQRVEALFRTIDTSAEQS
jgi:microsomal dipeptidase-like Zn-dependent dipeptidase